MNRIKNNEYDRIAGHRLSKLDGGIPRFIALSNVKSITLRNKLNRMGLEGPHIEAAVQMVDDIGVQEVLSNQGIGVRFATIPSAKKKPKIWSNKD